MYLNSESLQLTSLVIILICLTVILVCDRIMKKQGKKTLKRIDFMLDSEEKSTGLKDRNLKMEMGSDVLPISHVGERQVVASVPEI